MSSPSILKSITGLVLVATSTLAQEINIPNGHDYSGKKLTATVYNSGFDEGHDSYNSMGTGSDGKIYYVLSSESYDVGGKMFWFDPKTKKIKCVGELSEACGEKNLKAIPQGKSHVNFCEASGKLYFATHIGVYAIVDGRETMGLPPAGYTPYPGGHFLAYDMRSEKIEDLALNPNHDGIISATTDPIRMRMYGITWPSGHFLRYDIAKKELRDLGPIIGQNPAIPIFRALCRAPIVNPDDGSCYYTTVDGSIVRYVYANDELEIIKGENMLKDYFGYYDPMIPGTMGYNWRQTFWYSPEKVIYGVHGNSGYLFRFDPAAPRVELLDRLTSEPSKRSGMYDLFSFGYLGFALAPDNKTICYLTGGPIYVNGKRLQGKTNSRKGEAKGLEDLHLITYYIPTGKYVDHGAIFYPNGERPLWVNSISIGKDGTVYSLGRITENGKTRADLFSIPSPLKKAH